MGIETVCRVLKLRQSAIRVLASKLERGCDSVSADGRLRGMKTFFAAHTGRYSSHGIQLDNLPRGVEGCDVDKILAAPTLETVDAEAQRLGVSADDVLSSLIRPCLIAQARKLWIGDFNAIEARILAWLAGESRLLSLFESGGDPYCDFASKIFGRRITKADKPERFIGKTVILGAGYQLSHKKFSDYCRVKRINLVGCTPEQLIREYRGTYKAIPRLWKLYGRAIMSACSGREVSVAKCRFRHTGADMIITLPSGNELTYRQARIEDRIPLYAAYNPCGPKPTVVFESPTGERVLYGGKVTENIDQAIGAELLSEALVRVEAAGLRPVLTVHDEIVCECGDEGAQLGGLMKQRPAWGPELPIEVEIVSSQRYRKG